MNQSILVEYTAPTEIPNPARLTEYVEQQIQQHLDSVDAYRQCDCKLHVDIHTLEFSGKVCMNLTGTIGRDEVKAVIIRVNKPPKISVRYHKQMAKRVDWRRRNGLAVFVAWMFVEAMQGMGRCVLPSSAARAVGRPLFSGRVLRSLKECLSDIRAQLDATIGREASGGTARHKAAAWIAVLSGILGMAVAGIYYISNSGPSQDPTRTVLGILAGSLGFAGLVYGGTLLTLPRQYYESEAAGRRLLKLLGLKSPAAARTIGLGMLAVSLAVLALGTWAFAAG